MPADLDHPRASLRWDLFCRVVDNHGDLGVCWRLACRLAALGQQVRLCIDDDRALAWMAPAASRPAAIELRDWSPLAAHEALGDVVVETFGGDLPTGWLERMAASTRPPPWIDVEYLSAEAYVERSHALPSPQSSGPGAGLTRWFFYPGFTQRTGGLLLNAADERDGHRLLDALGLGDAPGITTISLFGYARAPVDAAVARWRHGRPTRLLACPGPTAQRLAAMLGVGGEPGSRRRTGALDIHWLPWLAQTGYDALLRTCDLNFVRGEDSFVQALASGRPFVWQLYPQDDGAHEAKLRAFLGLYLADAPSSLAAELRAAFAAWNLLPNGAELSLPPADAGSPWRHHAAVRRDALQAGQQALGDLGLRLYRYAAGLR